MNIRLIKIPARPRSKRLLRRDGTLNVKGRQIYFEGGGTRFEFTPQELDIDVFGNPQTGVLYSEYGFTVANNISTETGVIQLLWDRTGGDTTQYLTLAWEQSEYFYDFLIRSTPNELPTPRSIYVVFTENVTLRTCTVTVTQAGANLYTLTAYTAGTGSGTITSITPDPQVGGKYLAGTNVTLIANNGNSENDYFIRWVVNGTGGSISRYITITMNSDVTVEANFGYSETPPDEYVLSFTDLPVDLTVDGDDTGTKQAVVISTKNGSSYAWTASSTSSWINLISSSGNNGSTLSFYCSENTTNHTREASIIIRQDGGNRAWIYITQLVPLQRTLSVSPDNFSIYEDDTSVKEATVTSTAGGVSATWSAVSNQSWCTLGTSSGNNGGKLTFSCSANTGSSNRTAQITINQTGGSNVIIGVLQTSYPAYEFEVYPEYLTFTSSSGSNNAIKVNPSLVSGAAARWTASSNQTWCTLNQAGSSGTGTGDNIIVTVTQNTGSSRTAIITFRQTDSGQTRTVEIRQQGTDVQNVNVNVYYTENSALSGNGTITIYVNGVSKSTVSFALNSQYGRIFELAGVDASVSKTITVQMNVPSGITVSPSGSGGSVSSGTGYGAVTWSNSTATRVGANFSAN